MALAFDASSTARQPFGTSLSYTHTPVGTPRAVVVLVNINGLDDTITSLTYGGVALSKVTRTASGLAGTEIYLLGEGVPTGPKTVLASCSFYLDFWMTTVTLTADDDVSSVAVAGIANEFGTDVSLVLSTLSGYSGMVLSNIRDNHTPGSGFTGITTENGAKCEYASKSGANVTADWITGFANRYVSAIALIEGQPAFEVDLTPATTTDQAQELDYSVDTPIEITLTPATTTDQAQELSYEAEQVFSLTPATTTDEAQELSVRSEIVVVTRPVARPFEILGDWTFELASSSDLSKIGRLTESKSRSLTLTQDRAGALSMSLPLTHRLSREIEIARTCVLCKKGGQVLWSGPVWTLEKSAPGDLSIGCVGWLQTLEKRVTKPSWIADGKLSYASTDAGLIAHTVLDRSAEDVADGPVYVTSGGLETTQLRSETYQPFNSVLSIIMGLSAEEIEAGYYLNVHPVSRTLDIYASIGRARPEAVFTYGSSAASISQSFDASRLCNRFIAYSAIGWAQADNLISQAAYGVFEEAQSLSDVRSISILQAYANGEVAVRSDPLGFLAFTGAPSTLDGPRVPRIFEDFVVGDTVQVAGRKGALDVPRQPTRVYSATLTWPDKGGREVLSSVQTIASGS